MILAEWAGQITAKTAYRQNLAARMEAAQGEPSLHLLLP